VQAVSADPAGTWTGPVGRLNAEMLAAAVPDLADRDVFVCGPDPYMAHATTLLAGMGADPARIRQESFVLAEPAEPSGPAGSAGPAEGTTAEAGTHTVTFARTGKSIAVADGQTVLQAAKEVGLRIPTSCQNGLCGTCKIVKVSGDVDIAHNGGIRQREIDQGKILACCSRPRGPVVVDA
jgi:ferredoxin